MIETVLAYLNSGRGEEMTEEMNRCVLNTCQETLKMTMELNSRYHTPEEIVELMSEITGEKIDPSFNLFPPFYADFGRNIHIGKMSLSIPAAIFRIREVFSSGTMS